jgi:signal transduction histidine kinase
MAADRTVFLITRDHALAERLAEESLSVPEGAGESAARYQLPVAGRLEQARARLRSIVVSVILLDDSIVPGGQPLGCVAEELSVFAPAIVLAAPERQAELSELVAGGRVDVVVRSGNFFPVLLALLARHFRPAEESSGLVLPASFLESLRHEVNNPLTGILGNAEMLLARREQLPAAAAQRLETIAELALRVRESLRRLTWAWEDRRDVARTA